MTLRRLVVPLLLVFLASLPVAAQVANQALNEEMWEAARKGDAAAVAALLDKGADVNAKFRYGATALFKAAERGNVEVVKLLLARGADVKVKDTFYGATAMTWALQNEHFDAVRAIVEKDRESVDEVLLQGARSGQMPLVRIGLEVGGAKPETLTVALAAAKAADKVNQEIVDLLKKAGAAPPLDVEAATLQTYVGKYKSEQGTEVTVSQKDGKLIATVMGQPPIILMPSDKVTFKPVSFDGLVLTFKSESDKVTNFELQQGPTKTIFKRTE
ncbi:MAG TPA: ankyrin repeat domain-containing protein [Pyrinomonadaceae bacterium]|nr:ankyrin repeat domain-containing protein [Pyrinomonadaceae bacterium]